MDRPLRIAHCLESYAPALGGMPEVVKQLSERMVSKGHHVTVLTSTHPTRTVDVLNGVTIREFAISGNAVDGMQGDTSAYVDALRTGAFDVITFFAAQQWSTDAVLPHLEELTAKKVFVPTGFSALYDPSWADYYARMPEWLNRMDLNIFLSNGYRDVAFAKAHGVTNTKLIPNGAAAEEFDGQPTQAFRITHGISPEKVLILHIGSYTGLKGHREAITIFAKARSKDAVLALIGNGNNRLKTYFERHWRYMLLRWRTYLADKRILFLELDRPSTVEALKEADLFLFPSNLECSPIVLFEAMAAGIPFLASEAGNSGEIAAWSNGGWIIPGKRDALHRVHPDLSKGAHMLSELIADAQKRRSAGENGHRAWRERFTWQLIAEQYMDTYQDLVRTDT